MKTLEYIGCNFIRLIEIVLIEGGGGEGEDTRTHRGAATNFFLGTDFSNDIVLILSSFVPQTISFSSFAISHMAMMSLTAGMSARERIYGLLYLKTHSSQFFISIELDVAVAVHDFQSVNDELASMKARRAPLQLQDESIYFL